MCLTLWEQLPFSTHRINSFAITIPIKTDVFLILICPRQGPCSSKNSNEWFRLPQLPKGFWKTMKYIFLEYIQCPAKPKRGHYITGYRLRFVANVRDVNKKATNTVCVYIYMYIYSKMHKIMSHIYQKTICTLFRHSSQTSSFTSTFSSSVHVCLNLVVFDKV